MLPLLLVEAGEYTTLKPIFINEFEVVESFFVPHSLIFEVVCVMGFDLVCIKLDTEASYGDKRGGAAAACHQK